MVEAWQSRPLDALYPFVFLDALHIKVRREGIIENTAFYVVLGIDVGKESFTVALLGGGKPIRVTSKTIWRALMEGQVILAHLAQAFDWETLPGESLALETAVTPRPRGGLSLLLHDRR